MALRSGESYVDGERTDRVIKDQNKELIPLLKSDETLQLFLNENLAKYQNDHRKGKVISAMEAIDERGEQKYLRFKKKKMVRYATEMRKERDKLRERSINSQQEEGGKPVIS